MVGGEKSGGRRQHRTPAAVDISECDITCFLQTSHVLDRKSEGAIGLTARTRNKSAFSPTLTAELLPAAVTLLITRCRSPPPRQAVMLLDRMELDLGSAKWMVDGLDRTSSWIEMVGLRSWTVMDAKTGLFGAKVNVYGQSGLIWPEHAATKPP